MNADSGVNPFGERRRKGVGPNREEWKAAVGHEPAVETRLTYGKIRNVDEITVSSKGQIAIPKAIRTQLGLVPGSKLTVEVRGQSLVLSKPPDWRSMRGMLKGFDAIGALERERKRDRELEDRSR